MKKIIKLVTIAIVAAVGLGLCSMQGCEKKPETKNMHFKGKIIGEEKCSSGIVGYLIELDIPKNIGKELNYNGQRQNVVKVYPNSILSVDSVIEGVFYIPTQLPKRNCTAQFEIFPVPEIIIGSIVNNN